MLTPTQLIASGAFAGIANGFVSGPVEHIRIRTLPLSNPPIVVWELSMTPFRVRVPAGLQTQPSDARLYHGPWDAARKIWAQRGLAGIFKGQVATFGRESLGYGSYFLCYETLMQREMSAKGIRREQVHATHAVLYGAAAGYAVSAPHLRSFFLDHQSRSPQPPLIAAWIDSCGLPSTRST